MTTALTTTQKALLSGANPAVISTTDDDGAAVSVITWYLFEEPDQIVLSIDTDHSRGDRLAHIRRDGRFSLTVMSHDDWLRSVTIMATATEFFDDEQLRLIDQMAQHHGLSQYSKRAPRTAIRARITDALV